MLTIDFSRQSEKFLRKLPIKHAQQIIGRLQGLAADPASASVAPMKGYGSFMRLRAGEYRVVYEIVEGTVQVLLIGKRNDEAIYRHLERLLRR